MSAAGPGEAEEAAEGAADAADEPPVPTHVSAGWDDAEARLFPSVMLTPELYQRTVLLVGALLTRLRAEGPSTAALLAAADRATELVLESLDELQISPSGLDLQLVARSTLALRHREVVAEQAALRRVRLLARAGSDAQAWVVLEESGDWAGDPLRPYRRLEAHATSGRAVLVTTSADEDFRVSRHSVDEVRVDLSSGALQAPEEPPAGGSGAATHTDAQARERDVGRRRRRIAGA